MAMPLQQLLLLLLLLLLTSSLPAPAAAASPPSPDSYCQVSPPLDYSDALYAGWPQIPVAAEVLVYNGTAERRTYAHHPELFASGPSGSGGGDPAGRAAVGAFRDFFFFPVRAVPGVVEHVSTPGSCLADLKTSRIWQMLTRIHH